MSKESDRWLRKQVIVEPHLDHGRLKALYEHEPHDFPLPAEKAIETAKKQVCKRWGIENLEIIPRTPTGLHMSGILRLYINQYDSPPTFTEASEFFAEDDLKFSKTLYGRAVAEFKRANEPAQTVDDDDDEPDANKHTGPRAGAPAPRPRQTRLESGNYNDDEVTEVYELIEDQLQDLTEMAEKLNDTLLRDMLKNARRRASAGYLQHAEE